jgi:hypothetical protein
MSKTKLRLAQAHYETARELDYIHDSPKDWPYPPRNVRQKATLASRLQSITDSWVKERRRER